MSQVRDQVFVGNQPAGQTDSIVDEPLQDANFHVGQGFEILAVQDAGGRWTFSTATTQAQRREMVKQSEWFERNDRRIVKCE